MVARVREFFKRHRFLAYCVEIAMLCAMALVVARRARLFGDLSQIVLLFLLMGLPVLTRVFHRRLWLLVAANIFMLGSFAVLYLVYALPSLLEIREDYHWVPGMGPIGIMVPGYFIAFRKLIQLLIPFLFGIYCVRKRFRMWKFCVGLLCANVVVCILFYGTDIRAYGADMQMKLISIFLVDTVFLIAVLALPVQRRAFERLFGFPLRSSGAHEPEEEFTFSSSFVAHGTVGVIFLSAVFCVIFGHYERKMMQTIMLGEKPVYQSPALRNAYDDLKYLYTKRGKYPRRDFTYAFPSEVDVYYYARALPPDLADDALAVADVEGMERFFVENKEFFDAFESARDADYCKYYEPDRALIPDFLNFREVSRALATRAMLRMSQNRQEEAIHDAETILRIAWLLNDDAGTLVTSMIGVALRGIGLDCARSYYLRFREDPEALELLDDMLTRMKPMVRMSFDLEKLRRGEPGCREVVPYFEIVVPPLRRAHTAYYLRWVYYDFLVLGVALEKYHTEHSAYPGTLEKLVPEYLSRDSLDPFEGEPYGYTKVGSEFILSCPPLDVPERLDWSYNTDGWSFPNSKADDKDLREALKEIKSPAEKDVPE